LSTTVTLVIHGTFASDAVWWRLGGDGQESFADRLERELSRRDLVGTVWKPAFACGFDYSSFSWSGRNRHGDRMAGARRLSSSLNELARQLLATPNEPLTVNFVAHSHGGNVVLEALRRLKPNVCVGRIAFLGTPLITARPAFRAASFVFSAIVISLLFWVAVSVLDVIVYQIWTRQPLFTEAMGMWILAAAIPLVSLYAWIFWLVCNTLNVAFRLICRALDPLAWLRGRSRLLVYGPSQSKLKTALRGRPILLLTTQNDEADVLLQVGSAPGRLYREYVATRFSSLGRLLEFALLRPFIVGVFLKAVEMLLETFSLGFSVWRTLMQDFEVASGARQSYYPASLLIRQKLNIRPRAAPLAVPVSADVRQHDDKIQSSATLPRGGLRLSVGEITNELVDQIRLRHSAYYDNEAVILQVADFLAGAEVRQAETAQSFSIRPSPEFWEALLLANIGLWVLGVCIKGLPLLACEVILGLTSFVLLFGYVFPFIFFGISLSRAAWRRQPAKVWRRFWLLWAICGFVALLLLWAFGGAIGDVSDRIAKPICEYKA
jgi:hypothetical protein